MSGYPATIVVDLGFGDAGKGSVVDALARTRPVAAVVRFNGGGQAAHNVVTPDGRHHTFSQFGSATLVPGVRTHLSRFMLVDPVTLIAEAEHLAAIGCKDALGRLTVDGDAMTVTAFHKIANRFRETIRGDGRHGSCGMGIGETMADSIMFPSQTLRVRDLRDPAVLMRKLNAMHRRTVDEFGGQLAFLSEFPHLQRDVGLLADPLAAQHVAQRLLESASRFAIVGGDHLGRLARNGELVFEGAQGILLDEWYGFDPYTTWSTTTTANALTLLREIGHDGPVTRLGLVRAYLTRHGAGPFPTEDATLTAILPDRYNGTGLWQQWFRVGWFDTVLARYALAVTGGVDELGVTCLDHWQAMGTHQVSSAYDVPGGVMDANGRRVSEFRDGAPDLRVTGLRTKNFLTDLWFQANLTKVVASAKPVYRSAPDDPSAYLALIERELDLPVTLESWGPTAADKRFSTASAGRRTATA